MRKEEKWTSPVYSGESFRKKISTAKNGKPRQRGIAQRSRRAGMTLNRLMPPYVLREWNARIW
jgi:hypothetical protein